MRRLAALALFVAGCAAPAFVPPTPADAAYRDALLALRAADQAPRQRLAALLDRTGHAPPDSLYRPLARAVQAADAANLARLDALVDARGWPLASRVGTWAAGSAWLVVQHAPLAAQERYAPLLAAAVDAGEAEPAWLASLTDRMLVRQGRPQRYATEQWTDRATGRRGFYPVEDVAGLDTRRAAVGLEPVARYARRIGVPWPTREPAPSR